MIRHLCDLPRTQPESASPEAVRALKTLRRVVEDRLRGSCYSALGNVVCDDRGGVLWLTGRVPSQYLKQIAQEVVSAAVGTQPIVNEIEVAGSRAHPNMAP